MNFRNSMIVVISLLSVYIGLKTETRPNPKPTSTIFVGLSAPPTQMDPRIASDATSQRILDITHSSLFGIGEKLNAIPQIATVLSQSKNKILLKIRENVHFSNGDQLDVDDILFSFDFYKKRGSMFLSQLGCVKQIISPAPFRILIELQCADYFLLANTFPMKILNHRHPESVAGSGPYQVLSLNDSELVMEKNPFQSHIEGVTHRLVFRFIRDETTRFLRALKGEIDIIPNELPEDKVKLLSKNSQFSVFKTAGLNFNFINLNFHQKDFQDLEVRRAIFSALPIEKIILFKLEGLAHPANSLLAPGNPFSISNIEIDSVSPRISIIDAKKIIIRKGLFGKSYTLMTSQEAFTNAIVITQSLSEIGLKVSTKVYDWATFYSHLKKGQFEMTLQRWVGITDPDIYRTSLSSTEYPPGLNRGFYSNPTFDQLVRSAKLAEGFENKKNLYDKAQKLIFDDLAVLPLWYNLNIHVVRSGIKDFLPNLRGSFEPLISARKEN